MSLYSIPSFQSMLGLYEALVALGKTTNLQMCHDVGITACYPGSGQTVADLSGNSEDYNLGSGSGSDSADPAWNGTAGMLSAGEYFGVDSGEAFTDTDGLGSPSSWHNALHQADAMWAFVMACQVPSTGTKNIFGTAAANPTLHDGVNFVCTTSEKLRLKVVGNGSAAVLDLTTDAAITNGEPLVIVGSIDGRSSGTGFIQVNGSLMAVSASTVLDTEYASPGSNNADGALVLMGQSSPTPTLEPFGVNGGKFWADAFWQGSLLTTDEASAIFELIKGRWNIF